MDKTTDSSDQRDGFEDSAPEAALTYPLGEGPSVGGPGREIAPGVIWLRMPLGGSLAFINVWAIRDGDAWTLVDTGLQGENTTEAWQKAFVGPLQGLPVTRVIVTHMHPDHIGNAGWLTRRFGCKLWITRQEYLMCRVMAGDTGREAPAEGIEFYRAAGWDPDALDGYVTRFGGFGKALHALPDAYRRLIDGETLSIGGREWKVVTGAGHSPEHACLWCPELKLFISGDQVLPKITSNVSVFPTEPDGDPLDDWLTSLAKIRRVVPDDVLVLPAHNDPFVSLHTRVDQLIDFHEAALERLQALIAEPKRAVDVFHVLFKRKIFRGNLSPATGESLAHLNCLMHRGLARRERDAAGVDWYRAIEAAKGVAA
ncbi:MAG TPA: MBL fold metallo-hydrolase [Caulobacteraceae bacterium]|jgi:glyoxylase-like metal-dependent hydrolase (beta-lactamase superfamily II)